MIVRVVKVCSIAAVICGAAGVGLPQAPANRSDASIVLEIERLLSPDPTITDDEQRLQKMMADLRRVPALVRALERDYPQSRHLAAAYSLGIDALMLRRQGGDRNTPEELVVMARKLLGVANDGEMRAKARFVLLDVDLVKLMHTTTRPAPTTTTATTTASAIERSRRLAGMARKFICLADDVPRSSYAPAALFQAGAVYLEAGMDSEAVTAFGRLSRDYPKDTFALKALMVLVQLHTRAGRAKEALSAKRRVVEYFGGSAAAIKYRADIARAECIGKPFHLRFRAVRGRHVNLGDHRGKTVLVYFYASIVEARLAKQVVGELSGLGKLATKHGCVLVAVGADHPDRIEKVATVLNAEDIDTPNLLDPEGKVAGNYGVLFVPAVAIVAPDGTLKQILSEPDILAAVRKALSVRKPAG